LEVYGSDTQGFAERGFVYSAEMSLNILTPHANLIGKAFHSRVTVGQLYENDSPKSISIGNLIRISKEIEDVNANDGVFRVHGAVSNNNVVFTNSHNITNIPEEYSAESLEFLVIQRAAGSITTGDKITFSLINTIRGNAVFWPNAFDALANNVGQNSTSITDAKHNNYQSKMLHMETGINNTSHAGKTTDFLAEHGKKFHNLANQHNLYYKAFNWLSRRHHPVLKGIGHVGALLTTNVLHSNDKFDAKEESVVYVEDFKVKLENLRFPTLSISPGVIPAYDRYYESLKYMQDWISKVHTRTYHVETSELVTKPDDKCQKALTSEDFVNCSEVDVNNNTVHDFDDISTIFPGDIPNDREELSSGLIRIGKYHFRKPKPSLKGGSGLNGCVFELEEVNDTESETINAFMANLSPTNLETLLHKLSLTESRQVRFLKMAKNILKLQLGISLEYFTPLAHPRELLLYKEDWNLALDSAFESVVHISFLEPEDGKLFKETLVSRAVMHMHEKFIKLGLVY